MCFFNLKKNSAVQIDWLVIRTVDSKQTNSAYTRYRFYVACRVCNADCKQFLVETPNAERKAYFVNRNFKTFQNRI